ncbi:hypothetical protein HOD30_02025 [Candidatus Peregrinibacteria bacterium]|jgi:hypothetical protein|nr:hypothetical protein [Candidatus Peregrinibacteria bacterium]MBT4631815.1 hypothetical protein [Candidatus Peregrinibacteria bacterium]MBT5516516.1 hypothetical protein [Candidatus Peregrinibacteria bacterium]MBT5824460.1 hypothetical protein [Candidatus Peregrinibacteria bacterium]
MNNQKNIIGLAFVVIALLGAGYLFSDGDILQGRLQELDSSVQVELSE